MCRADGNIARGALLTLLLAPLVMVLDRLDAVGELTLFVLAGAALIPLSWLIGEATDNLARHTGPGIGGFLNATFGNAPELIIAIIAVSGGLTAIVRASLVGSIAGNLLLVLGFTLLFGQTGLIDRRSAYISLGLVGLTTVVVLVAAAPGLHGDPDRRSLAELSVPVAILLLVVGVTVTRYALRSQWQLFRSAEPEGTGWPLPAAIVVLGVATIATAFVSETLIGTLRAFAYTAHLSEFFVAVVIIAIIGNATEHGSAVLLARRGRVKLATEIPLASSAQIAGLVIPLVALISWGFKPLALSFRPVELAAMAVAAALPALVLRTGRTTRLGGAILLAAYSALAVACYLSGDRLRAGAAAPADRTLWRSAAISHMPSWPMAMPGVCSTGCNCARSAPSWLACPPRSDTRTTRGTHPSKKGRAAMRLGVHLVNFSLPGGTAAIGPALAAAGHAAEDAGLHNLSLMDHYLQLDMAGGAGQPMLEGYTTLGFLAAHTRTVELQLLVTGVTYRRPGLLAKIVTTLDVLSGGRAALGLGAAWYAREHAALGVPFPPLAQRFERLEETLQIVHQMWSDDDNGPFTGKYYQLAETLNVPQPLSRPHPPIMIGGGGEKKTLRLLARYADACNLFAGPQSGPEQVKAKLDVLAAHCAQEGTGYDRIRKTILWASPLDPTADGGDGFVEQMRRYADAGIEEVHVMPFTGDPAAFIHGLGRNVAPHLAGL